MVWRGGHSSWVPCTASAVCEGAEGQAGTRAVLCIASEHLNLPCAESKFNPCKPFLFHAPAQWAAHTSLNLSLACWRATLVQDHALTSPPMWTFNVPCLRCQWNGHRDFYPGHLATVMMSWELFCTSDYSSPAVKGSVDLKLDQAAVFRSGEVPMGAVPSLCTVSLLFREEVRARNWEEPRNTAISALERKYFMTIVSSCLLRKQIGKQGPLCSPHWVG